MRKERIKLLVIVLIVVLVAALGLFRRQGKTSDTTRNDKTLRVVMLGSQNETLEYGQAQTYFPWAVMGNVCDVLVRWRNGRLEYQLATSIEPNDDATRWTIRLRPNVYFSDGSRLSAADVLTSLQQLSQSIGFGSFFQDVDFTQSHAPDALTLTLQLIRPRADLVPAILAASSMVWKAGGQEGGFPVCSGPWQVNVFDGINGAELTRNPHAWQPAVYFERIVIRPLVDAAARVNALLSGVSDYAFDIPVSSARMLQGKPGFSVLRSGIVGANAFYFSMNTRIPPFDDLEVRQALKALINRQRLVDVVLEGYGYPGNDLFGQGLSGGNTLAWPIKHDVEAARRVFAQKGVTSLTMLTADLTPGLNNAAELLRQQLADVGVTLTLVRLNPADYLSDIPRLHQTPLMAMFALNRPFVAALPILFGNNNPYNYSGWYPPEMAALIERLRATPEPLLQQPLLQQLQTQVMQEGPYLVWGYRDQLSGAVKALQGVELSQGIPLFAEAKWTNGVQENGR